MSDYIVFDRAEYEEEVRRGGPPANEVRDAFVMRLSDTFAPMALRTIGDALDLLIMRTEKSEQKMLIEYQAVISGLEQIATEQQSNQLALKSR